MSYVGYVKVASASNLYDLIRQYSQPEGYFFLRWLHCVSGISNKFPEQLSPQGQMFNASMELRWKKRRQSYDILWLGQQAPDSKHFNAIKRQWKTEDHPTLLHQRKTPQYPNLFRYPKDLEKRIGQRYFRDADTGIVHFVALTVSEPESSKANINQE